MSTGLAYWSVMYQSWAVMRDGAWAVKLYDSQEAAEEAAEREDED